MPINVNIEGTKQLTNMLVDVFSPATELIGTLGDRVRVYREMSLLRSLKRTKEIAAEEGLRLKEPPLKFLVPYLEECSLEDPDDFYLVNMWAKLLASSSAGFRPEHNLFIRMLRDMTSSEAKLLEYVASPRSHPLYTDHWHLEDVASAWDDPYVYIAMRDCIAELNEPLSHSVDFKALELAFRKKHEPPGTVVYYFDVAEGQRGVYPLRELLYTSPRGAIDDDFERTSIAILKSLGLLGDYTSPELWFGNHAFDIRAYYVTELGTHFIKSCTQLPPSSGPKQPNTP